MARWESDAQARLEGAALELFESQGFDRTTVAQIARVAGLTERSFYRYFPDKREVLFGGNQLQAHLAAHIKAADSALSPIDALLSALGAAEQDSLPREALLRRLKIISANPSLAERDLIKLADIAKALVPALEERGIEKGEARFLIDVAMALHHRATLLWLDAPSGSLSHFLASASAELSHAVAPAIANGPAAAG